MVPRPGLTGLRQKRAFGIGKLHILCSFTNYSHKEHMTDIEMQRWAKVMEKSNDWGKLFPGVWSIAPFTHFT